MYLNIRELPPDSQHKIKEVYKQHKTFREGPNLPLEPFADEVARCQIKKFKREKKSGENSWIRYGHTWLRLNNGGWLGHAGTSGATKACYYYKSYADITNRRPIRMVVKICRPADASWFTEENNFNIYAKLTGRKDLMPKSFIFTRHNYGKPLKLKVRNGKVDVPEKKYIVMPYLGLPIKQFFHCTQLTLQQKLKIIISLIDKVISLHEEKYAHRDINPENICVNFNEKTGDFEAELVDFDTLIQDNEKNLNLLDLAVTTEEYTSRGYSIQSIFERDRISLIRTIFMPTLEKMHVRTDCQRVKNSWSLLTTNEFDGLPEEIKFILNFGRHGTITSLPQLKEQFLEYVKSAQQNTQPSSKRQRLALKPDASHEHCDISAYPYHIQKLLEDWIQ